MEQDEDDRILTHLLFSKGRNRQMRIMDRLSSFKGPDVVEATIRVPRGGYHD